MAKQVSTREAAKRDLDTRSYYLERAEKMLKGKNFRMARRTEEYEDQENKPARISSCTFDCVEYEGLDDNETYFVGTFFL